MLKKYYNEQISLNLSKKHFNFYFKGFEGASFWRKIFMKIKCTSEINDLMKKIEKAFQVEII